MTKKIFHATVVADAVAKLSYQGRPRTREQELEITHDQVQAMRDKLVGAPIVYNHKRHEVCGSVLSSHVLPDGSWDIEYEMDTSTWQGREAEDWIQKGIFKGVSLCHNPNSNTPIEVSWCAKGARPGTVTHNVGFDSNEGRYTMPKLLPEDTSVAASDTPDCDIYVFEEMSVKASVTDAADPVANKPAEVAKPVEQAMEVDEGDEHKEQAKDGLATIQGIIGNKNKIPSMAERQQIIDAAATTQLEAEKAKRESEELKKKLADMEAQMAAMQQKADEERKKLEAATEERLASTRNKVADLIHNCAPDKTVDLKSVMASMPQNVMEVLGGVADTVKASMHAPPTEEELIDSKAMRALNEFRNSRSTPAVVRASSSSSSFGLQPEPLQERVRWNMLGPVLQRPQEDLVQASSNMDEVDQGQPLLRPPQRRALVQASAHTALFHAQPKKRTGRGSNMYSHTAQADWVPGAGANFDRTWMERDYMREVWYNAPGGHGCKGDIRAAKPIDFFSKEFVKQDWAQKAAHAFGEGSQLGYRQDRGELRD